MSDWVSDHFHFYQLFFSRFSFHQLFESIYFTWIIIDAKLVHTVVIIGSIFRMESLRSLKSFNVITE